MRWLSPGILAWSVLVPMALPRAVALEVRGYSQTLHHRLIPYPGPPVYDPTPAPNPSCIVPAANYLAIGWPAHPTEWTRHITLVSPRHFVGAAHYPLGGDWRIAFLGTDGRQHLYGIESQVPVPNAAGETTDLLLGTLSSAVDPALVPFCKILNLPNEADYTGQPMVVNGSFVHVGRMPLAGFITLANDPDPYWGRTRYAYFDYDTTGGLPDDCRYQGGDSGSPVFIVPPGEDEPGLIGTASGQDSGSSNGEPLPPNTYRNYLNFLPAYFVQTDALMEAQGYHLRRYHPAATTLEHTVAGEGPLRQLKPGKALLTLANSGPAEAHNLTLRLIFSEAPSSLNGPGWICEAESPLIWNCRRGGLTSGTQTAITADWALLSHATDLHVTGSSNFDGGPPGDLVVTLPLAETYASWSHDLADPGQGADPDHDGLTNLLEYALGGAPEISGRTAVAGYALLPQATRANNRLIVKYPRRTDAAARGLTTGLEFSTALEADGWTAEAPAGATFESAPFSPPSDGFEEVTVSIPMDQARRFVRLKVTLAE